MALTDNSGNIYTKCSSIKTTKPVYDVDEKLYKEIATGYRLLPTFESTLYDTVLRRHYSLQRNELLKCRWTQYKQNIETRVFAPFQFPDIRELHFYNCAIRFRPEASIHSWDHRMKVRPGPGVDSLGSQLPIPQEAMMKRGTAKKPSVKKTRKVPESKEK